ncbi:hypothetical protein JHK82_044278 [Glycine max]|nr:hypothetical protein JHK82_044278 [Glycine max]
MLEKSDLVSMVKHGWSQNVYDEIISKLDYCANALMPWGNQVCACFEKDIQRCKQKLEELRISRESLPARQRLSTKGVQCPITCASCGNCPETYHHAFVGCCNVETVWEKASLWHIINLVRDKVSTQQPQPASTRKLQWGTPAPEYIKCNVDVAIFQDSRSFGVDCCFKDSTSHFIRAKTSWYQGIPTTHEAEDEDDVGAPSSKNHVELLKDVIKPLSKPKVDNDVSATIFVPGWVYETKQLFICSPDQLDLMQGFRTEFLRPIIVLGNSSSKGMFIDSCYAHCQTKKQGTWLRSDSLEMKKTTIARVVANWFYSIR